MSQDRQLGIGLVDRATWRYLASFFRSRLPRLVLSGAVAAGQAVLVVPVVVLVRAAFDHAIPEGDVRLLLWIGAGVLAVRLASSLLTLWLRKVNLRLIKDATLELRADLLERLYTFSRVLYTSLDRDTTHARVVQDSERFDAAANEAVSRLLPSLLASLPLIGLMAVMSWRLTLVMAALFPLLVVTVRLTTRYVQRRVYACHRSFEGFSKGVYFVLRYMDLTRLQSSEVRELERQRRYLRDVRDTSESMAFSYSLHGQAQSAVISLSGVVLLIYGGASVARQAMTLGELLAYWVAAGLLYGHLTSIMRAIPQVICGLESGTTLSDLALSGPTRPYCGTGDVRLAHALRLEGVSFGYGSSPVLRNVDMVVSPGDRIAIIGSNGAGKTTLVALLLGFYRPDCGRLLVDDVPYEQIDIVRLRRLIGVVPQNPELFSGTVLENVTYGNAGVAEELVVEAAELALADEFIRDLPGGYSSHVGDGGVLLSRGQVQRLAIARALVRRPALIVLDEPTNHLDRDAIHRLMDRLDGLEPSPARLVISHDPEVVRHAARTYEIRDGELLPVARCEPVPVAG